VIENPAGGADHDMGAVFEGAELGAEGDAAAEGEDLDVVGTAGQASQFLADLVGEFPGRTQHQPLHLEAGHVQPRQEADAKGGGFAAAGLGLGDDVASRQNQRQAVGLNGGHLVIAEGGKIPEHRRLQGQGGKGGRVHGWFSSWGDCRGMTLPVTKEASLSVVVQ